MNNFSIPISRRGFMKLVGITAACGLFNNITEMPKVEAAGAMTVNFNSANIPTLISADVCVCGGGSAGTAAAINAARNGAKTVLIERGIVLGGLQTQGLVYPCMPTYIDGSDTPYIKDINKRMKKFGVDNDALIANWTNKEESYGEGKENYPPEILALIYDEMCAESGVDILYEATLISAVTTSGRITKCIIQTRAGIYAVEAKIFIDTTGDALLSRFAGVPSEKGSEKTGRNQPISFRFEMGGIDTMKAFKYAKKNLPLPWEMLKPPQFEFAKTNLTKDFFEAGVQRGEVTQDDILYIQAFTIVEKPGTMSMNCPELPPLEFSSTDPLSYSKAVTFGRQMIRRLSNFFIKNIPGFENAYISREASILGVRESWRIRGKYYMTAEDYFGRKKFSDAVARTAYPIDIHDVELNFGSKPKKGEFYEIPFRAMVTDNFSNLIVAGRCISASFAAQASSRIQPTCMSMGEAAGIAASYALKNNIAANMVEWEKIPESQRSYVSQG